MAIGGPLSGNKEFNSFPDVDLFLVVSLLTGVDELFPFTVLVTNLFLFFVYELMYLFSELFLSKDSFLKHE